MIRINQVGYRPADVKVAVADGCLSGKPFCVVDDADGHIVHSGVFGAVQADAATESQVCHGDFSAVVSPGKYRVVSEQDASYAFPVAENVYDAIFRAAARMLYMQRCGVALPEALAGDYAHPACHDTPAVVWGETRTREVNGGWHDAGDYGRYVVPGAKTVADLLLLWELRGAHPGVAMDDLNIPESGNGVPDLLDEARFELEWMLKMQEDNGGVYHKVSCHHFPGFVMPEEERDTLVLSPVSDAATADFAAVMYKAAVDYASFDAAFAARCRMAADRAWAYVADRELTGFVNPPDVHTGSYSDRSVQDELFFAAAARAVCLRREGRKEDARTAQVIAEALAAAPRAALGWADVSGYALFELACFLDNETARELLLRDAEAVLASQTGDGYLCTLGTGYHWGSCMDVANHGMLLMLCDHLSPDDRFRRAAKQQLDWLLGVNGLAFCFVSGFGVNSLCNPHHRPSGARGHAVPGMLSGGPNRHIQDDYARQMLQGKAPALCFVDHVFSYSTNEIAIYWNTPLIFLLGSV